jgi:hypothetical protein
MPIHTDVGIPCTHLHVHDFRVAGLERVKTEFRKELDRIRLAQEQGLSPDTSLYNARFDGNPGTGKTTAARIYSRFLVELGVLPEDAEMIETSGPKLAHAGIPELEKLLQKGKDKGGACVFVDEAYALNPQQDRTGGQVLNFILPHAEKLCGQYGKVVFVFAGYTRDMDKLFEHNEGLPSRFPRHFVFEDYTEAELLSIFNALLVNPNGAKTSANSKKKDRNSNGGRHSGDNTEWQYMHRSSLQYMHGAKATDKWGHEWVFDAHKHTWADDVLGNTCGYGPIDSSHPLGSDSNPVYRPAADGKTLEGWVYDEPRSKWHVKGSSKKSGPLNAVKYPGEQLILRRPFELSDAKWGRVAMRRLARMRGKVGFGNARAVKNLFDSALRRQAQRISRERESGLSPEIHVLVRDDLLGPKGSEAVWSRCEAYKELMDMEGLDRVKESVKSLLSLVVANAEREDNEKPLHDVVLNRVFLGNPGTGKTTVAKLYAKILCDFGLLSKGDVILKNPSDFKGDV